MDRASDGLLGRGHEWEEIQGHLSDPDGPRLVFVRGERGVGRSAFVRAVGDRLRARGTAVVAVACVPADRERPLLLALRLFLALEEQRCAVPRQRRPVSPVHRALSAMDGRDRTAMQKLLRVALARSAPVAVLVDDAQHADDESLSVLGGMDLTLLAPEVRLVMSAARHPGPGPGEVGGGTATRARTVVLSRLGPRDTSALVARWLRATPDAALVRRVRELTHGIPAAVDALLTGWTRRGDVRIADSHAFIGSRTPVPVLPGDDRFVAALDALGEPCRAVADALSILWPLGPPVLELIAAWRGSSADAVGECLRTLVESGVVEELRGPDGVAAQGWAFQLPLTEHTVRERLPPTERSRLSAMAVGVLWADADRAPAGKQGPATVLDEVATGAYLADRIADARTLVDRERAAAELTAAAERVRPGANDRGMLRWLSAAADLIEQPAAHDLALQRYATAAYVAGDYRAGRTIAEVLLRDPGEALTELALQEAACLRVAVTANEQDWRGVSRLATARWWDALPVPAVAKVTGQALALCRLARWREAVDLLAQTEPVWNTSPPVRAAPRIFSAAAELALGRPEPFRRELAMREASELPPVAAYALAVALCDELFAGYDVDAANALMGSLGLTVEVLPPLSRFLWHHLTGRWDQALESARRLLATSEIQTPASDGSLLPARTADILLARGRTTSALHLLESVRGSMDGPPQCSLHACEARVLRTLGDLDGAERTLRTGLEKAQAHAQSYGTEELWALLAEVTAEAARTAEAVSCLEHLERIAVRTGSGRARLRHLLASARVLRQDAPETARGFVCEAVELARRRGLPWETATALVAAVDAGAGPATLLREAYDLFGVIGAALWRFRTRTVMRDAGVTVPGRKQAAAENEHLLATLIAEGLSNRQIASVLRLREDAVAQRLSRLFTRTGVRSRTEIVTAVLTGSR